jgi:hypothetical protein
VIFEIKYFYNFVRVQYSWNIKHIHEGQTEEQDEVIYEVCYIGENVGRQAR